MYFFNQINTLMLSIYFENINKYKYSQMFD